MTTTREDAQTPLLLAFAQTRTGIRPLHLYQAKALPSSEEPCKVLLVDTYLGDPDHMAQKLKTLCEMSVQVVGALTFLRGEDEFALGCPLTSVFTRTSLIEFCREHSLVPPYCRHAVDRYLHQLQ